LEQNHKVIEGAAGVVVAAFVKSCSEPWMKGKNVVLLMCGSNISTDNLLGSRKNGVTTI
jgi:threonine dehydratase